ncbi:lipopolysaccharide biosynthesis protein [soil metagenome]
MERALNLLPPPMRRIAGELLAGRSDLARSGQHAIAAFLIRIMSAVLAFLSQVLLARWMDSFDYGIFTFAWIWVTVIGTLCAAGFSTSVIRFLPEYYERGLAEHFRGFLRAGTLIAFGLGTLAMILGIAVLYGWRGLTEPYYVMPLALAFLCLPAYAVTDFQDGVGRSQRWIDLALGPPYILRPLLILAFSGAAFLAGFSRDAETGIIAAVVATWLTAVVQFGLQRRRLRPQVPTGPRSYRLGPWVRASMPLLLLECFALFMLNLDILILGVFVGPGEIAIYFAAVRTISLVTFIHFAVAAVAMPKFAALFAKDRPDEIFALFRTMQKWCFLPTAAGTAVLLLLGEPLLAMFGPDFVAAYPLMFVLAVAFLVRALAGPAQNLLSVTGHQDTAAFILMLTVLIGAGLNLLLIPLLGLTGAAIATAAAFVFEATVSVTMVHRLFAPNRLRMRLGGGHGQAAE